jgi:hypothetical protein
MPRRRDNEVSPTAISTIGHSALSRIVYYNNTNEA